MWLEGKDAVQRVLSAHNVSGTPDRDPTSPDLIDKQRTRTKVESVHRLYHAICIIVGIPFNCTPQRSTTRRTLMMLSHIACSHGLPLTVATFAVFISSFAAYTLCWRTKITVLRDATLGLRQPGSTFHRLQTSSHLIKPTSLSDSTLLLSGKRATVLGSVTQNPRTQNASPNPKSSVDSAYTKRMRRFERMHRHSTVSRHGSALSHVNSSQAPHDCAQSLDSHRVSLPRSFKHCLQPQT